MSDPQLKSIRVHAAVSSGTVVRNAIVRYTTAPSADHTPEIRPFDGEIHSTSDLNAVIVIAPESYRLPASLDHRPDLSRTGSFDRYLNALASTVPPVKSGEKARTIIIDF